MASRTDRQTDPAAKSSWWSITSFDEDEWDRMKQPDKYPAFVKAVYGGLEEGTESKKKHFQGALNTQHVRFSQVKSWLSKSHIEKGMKPESLVKYAMKSETAIEEKVKRSNPRTFLEHHDLCEHIAYYGIPAIYREKKYEQAETNTIIPDATESMFWNGVSHIIFIRPDLSAPLSKFNMNFWLKTADTWLARICQPGWSPRLVLPEEPDEEKECESPEPEVSCKSPDSLISHSSNF